MVDHERLQDHCHIQVDGQDAPERALQTIMRVTVEQGLHLPALCLLRLQDDDLDLIRGKIVEADALVFATPVYWHDLSESAKRFLDRLRRTEAFSGRDTCVGTRAIGVAAAGGSGNGAARALYNLEDYFKRVGLEIVDLVTLTRFSRDHKLLMLEQAGRRLAQGVPGVKTR